MGIYHAPHPGLSDLMQKPALSSPQCGNWIKHFECEASACLGLALGCPLGLKSWIAQQALPNTITAPFLTGS